MSTVLSQPATGLDDPRQEARGAPAIRCAFVTLFDASDVTRMSGTGYNISQSLIRGGLDLKFVGSLKCRVTPINLARHGFNRFVLRKNDHPQRDTGFLKHYARQVRRRLDALDVDVIFASGTLPVSYLDTDLPLVMWTDCTFANLLDYYPRYCNMSKRSIRAGHAADRAMYERVDQAIFTSPWAARSAIEDYGLDPARATVVSRGANVPGRRTEDEILALVRSRPTDRCILHFAGVDWLRKGGDIAVEAARSMIERGIPTELRVLGVEPQINGPMPDFIRPLGYVSKATPEGMARFTKLLGEARFLIVPTRADAYGFVFLEAAAFGVPSMTTRTGGVPHVVPHGVSGLLFDYQARGEAYADEMERLFRDRDAYTQLAMSSFNDHQTRTNWDVVTSQLISVVHRALAEHRTRNADPSPAGRSS